MKLWIPVVLILSGVGVLMAVSISQLGMPELQVREVLAAASPEQRAEIEGKRIKLHGKIKKIHSETRPLRFDIHDKTDPDLVVTATIDSVRPDLFKVDNDVAVEGIFNPDTGALEGDKIYTKCPSKYVASEELGASDGEQGSSYGSYEKPAAQSEETPVPAAETP